VTNASHFQTCRVEYKKLKTNCSLYEIITVRLGYHKFCAIFVPKMLTGAHKMQRMASSLIFLERYLKGGNKFLNLIVRVAVDET
jgi:hypothetical protein